MRQWYVWKLGLTINCPNCRHICHIHHNTGVRGPFRGAWRKGYLAYLRGESEQANPYPDLRTNYRNTVTFSRAFRRAWLEGYRAAERLNARNCPRCGQKIDLGLDEARLLGNQK